MTKFNGKTAIVLGGTSGIGLATTQMLRDGGARVIAGGRRECRIDGVVVGVLRRLLARNGHAGV